jgi:molybdenum cofactor synthesis domain-containing protein
MLVEWLRGKGFHVGDPVVRADGEEFAAALRAALGGGGGDGPTVDAARPHLVITSGGTGISPTDVTPQITAELLDYEIPGLAEALRRYGADKGVPTAMLSRGLVGVVARTLVVNLPGSSGGVRDGMAVLDGVLGHALDQLAGGDHVRPDAVGNGADGHDTGHAHDAAHGPGESHEHGHQHAHGLYAGHAEGGHR